MEMTIIQMSDGNWAVFDYIFNQNGFVNHSAVYRLFLSFATFLNKRLNGDANHSAVY